MIENGEWPRNAQISSNAASDRPPFSDQKRPPAERMCDEFRATQDKIEGTKVNELYDVYIENKNISASIRFGPFLTNDMNIYTDDNYKDYTTQVDMIINEILSKIDDSGVKGKLIIKHDYEKDKKNNIQLKIQICSIRDFFKVETLFRLYSSKYIRYALEVDSNVSAVNLFSINDSTDSPSSNKVKLIDQYKSIMSNSNNIQKIFAQREKLLKPDIQTVDAKPKSNSASNNVTNTSTTSRVVDYSRL
jgi:hypothetical protein